VRKATAPVAASKEARLRLAPRQASSGFMSLIGLAVARFPARLAPDLKSPRAGGAEGRAGSKRERERESGGVIMRTCGGGGGKGAVMAVVMVAEVQK